MKAKRDSCFIRSKVNKGKTYWYLVRCQRVHGKPRQQVIAYLGNQQPKDVADARRIMGEREEKAAANEWTKSLALLSTRDFESSCLEILGNDGPNTTLLKWLPVLKRLEYRVNWRLRKCGKIGRARRKEGKRILDEIREITLRAAQTYKQTVRMITDSQTTADFFKDGWKRAAAFDPRVPMS